MLRRFKRRPDDAQHSRDDDYQALVDPLGDLLLSVAAILVLATIVMLPLVDQMRAPAEDSAEAPTPQSSPLDRGLQPLLATRFGLRFGRASADIATVDKILDDARLFARLEEIRRANADILLLIDPDGLESAFVFDAVARSYVTGKIIQIRLSQPCSEIRTGALAGFCRGEAANAPT